MTNQLDLFNPETFTQLQRIARTFASSEIVPDMYKVSVNNPEPKAVANCVVAMDMSARMNLPVSAVMQNLYIVKGNPAWSSKFIISQINLSGRFKTLRFKISNKGVIKDIPYMEYKTKKVFTEQVYNLSCYAYTSLIDSEEEIKGPSVTIEMAIREGWYTKAGSKWPSLTEVMLQYRAAKFWGNAYAPELTLGLPTVDEVEDVGTIDIEYEEIKEKNIISFKEEKPGKGPEEEEPGKEEKPDEEEPGKEEKPDEEDKKPTDEKPKEGKDPKLPTMGF